MHTFGDYLCVDPYAPYVVPAGGRTHALEIAVAQSPKTVTVTTAAQVLGISCGLAYELVHRGELRAVRLGRRLVVPVEAIDELLGSEQPQ